MTALMIGSSERSIAKEQKDNLQSPRYRFHRTLFRGDFVEGLNFANSPTMENYSCFERKCQEKLLAAIERLHSGFIDITNYKGELLRLRRPDDKSVHGPFCSTLNSVIVIGMKHG